MSQLHQLGCLWRRQERKLGLDRRGCCAGWPGGRDSLGQRHAEVDPVDENLEHGRDDGRAAGRTGGQERSPWLSRIVGAIELRGRLPGAGVRSGAVPMSREVEVGQLVVEQESTSRHDHGVTAGLLDRQRVLHDVAPPVGDREVGGPPLVGQHQRRLPRWRTGRSCRRGRPEDRLG